MRSLKNIIAAILLSLIIINFADAQVVVKVIPQRPKVVKVKTISPAKGMVWVDGHWILKNNKYVWTEGVWIKPKPNHIRIAGFWKKVPGGWVWIDGHWKKVQVKKRR